MYLTVRGSFLLSELFSFFFLIIIFVLACFLLLQGDAYAKFNTLKSPYYVPILKPSNTKNQFGAW